MTAIETREYTCDICGGPLGQQRWRGFPPICSKCEMESIHDTPGLSGPYLDSYNRLRDLRNTLADIFRYIEEEGEELSEGDPIVEVIEQIQDLAETFRETVVSSLDDDGYVDL
ncbi:MAG TPA: hypothetical protein VKX16_16025 [Chloroflexota bacterium]|nr:hypothetical protein [Chloroflexota bacterium]